MRKPYVAGNWKMNLDRRGALALCGTLREHLGGRTDVDAAVAPPAPNHSSRARRRGDARMPGSLHVARVISNSELSILILNVDKALL